MRHATLRSFGLLLIGVFTLTLAAPVARADGEDAGAKNDPIAVKIELDEKVDGKKSKYMIATYYIRKKLREAGFWAYAAEKISRDDQERKAVVAKAAKSGEEPPPYLEETKPEPELLFKGTCTVKYDRSSEFYGAELATVYKSSYSIEVTDAATGEVLATLDTEEEWGRKDKKSARNESLKRIGLFAACDALTCEPIQQRLTDSGKTAVQSFVDKINKQRKKK